MNLEDYNKDKVDREDKEAKVDKVDKVVKEEEIEINLMIIQILLHNLQHKEIILFTKTHKPLNRSITVKTCMNYVRISFFFFNFILLVII